MSGDILEYVTKISCGGGMVPADETKTLAARLPAAAVADLTEILV